MPRTISVGKTFFFDAAHRLRNHDGKCRNLHGHTYKVEVSVYGTVATGNGSSAGMVLDFVELKAWWQALDAVLDHTTLLHVEDPLVEVLSPLTKVTTFDNHPTAEYLAEFIANDMQDWLANKYGQSIYLEGVKVYETPTSWAEA